MLRTGLLLIFTPHLPTMSYSLPQADDSLDELHGFIQNLPIAQPDSARKVALDKLADWIHLECTGGSAAPTQVNFICTHNSRRSQLAQAWLSALADWAGLTGIRTYSGGTEVTAFHPEAVGALSRSGFGIHCPTKEQANPEYQVTFGQNADPLRMFSKRFDDAENPDANFIAVMVCTDAEEACPFVPGASHRLALPYLDPKHADGTDLAPTSYDECSRTIASELFYVIHQILNHE